MKRDKGEQLMNYLNSEFKLTSFYKKSKKKYNKILEYSKDNIPNFLSTKHNYKRRKSLFFDYVKQKQISPINIKSIQKKETNLLLSKLASQRSSIISNNSNSKNNDSLILINNLLVSDNSKKRKKTKKHLSSIYQSNLSAGNENRYIKKKLTHSDKKKLKVILDNFNKNKLTTDHLCKQEKKLFIYRRIR